VVVLNDNKMSIGPNVGALSEHLSRLTMKPKYQTFRRRVDQTVKRIPKVGAFLYDTIVRLKRGIKAVFYPENLFVDLGFEYVGPIEGHDIHALEQVFADVRRLGKPVVVHVITRKGKGYEFAEHDPSAFHGVTPFSIADGIVERSGSDNFTDAFGRAIHGIGLRDERVVAVSAAMEKGTGLALFRSSFPDRFFDVGIAEEHAVTFAAGLAAKGLRPVVAIYSTFIQRSVDQVIHDVALQNLPVVIALDRSGFVGDDGETHQGLFDIALFKSVPNLALLAPASGVELRNMLEWAIAGALPCIIRYPKTSLPEEAPEFSLPLVQGRGVFLRESRSSLCIAFAGGLYEQALGAAELLEREGCKADLYNLRFMKPLDEDYLLRIMDSYDLWVVVEEGLRAGGIGEKIAALAAETRTKVLYLGAPDAYFAQGSRSELLERAGLDARGIAGSVLAACSPIDRMTVLKAASH
jgi:1-deoxy-D-xylulose-5-phosphate synthase